MSDFEFWYFEYIVMQINLYLSNILNARFVLDVIEYFYNVVVFLLLKGDLSCKMHFCTSFIHEYVSPVCQERQPFFYDVRKGVLRLYGQLSTYQGNVGLGHGHCCSKALETL